MESNWIELFSFLENRPSLSLLVATICHLTLATVPTFPAIMTPSSRSSRTSEWHRTMTDEDSFFGHPSPEPSHLESTDIGLKQTQFVSPVAVRGIGLSQRDRRRSRNRRLGPSEHDGLAAPLCLGLFNSVQFSSWKNLKATKVSAATWHRSERRTACCAIMSTDSTCQDESCGPLVAGGRK